MLIVFFDIRGVVHHEYVPAGQTVKAKFYVEVLKRLRERVRLARPELWAENAWILHQDNAPSHTALVTREFLAKNKITTMDHPPYSPDLAPCDFYLFPKVKNIMRGEHFVDVDTIKRETTKLLKELTKEDMQHCFQEWEKRWTKCILSGGEYFEGDHIPVPE
jgi:[histone H3]-lysine36 N-dimethyltransferase SETMAR